MRTLIEGGWVVAFNGTSHEVYEQGSVVFEDDRIVHAGRRLHGHRSTRGCRRAASSCRRGSSTPTCTPAGQRRGLPAARHGQERLPHRELHELRRAAQGQGDAAARGGHGRAARVRVPPRAQATAPPPSSTSAACAATGTATRALVDELGVRVYGSPPFRDRNTFRTRRGASTTTIDTAAGTEGLKDGRRRSSRATTGRPRGACAACSTRRRSRRAASRCCAPAKDAARELGRARAHARGRQPHRVPADHGGVPPDADPVPGRHRLPRRAHAHRPRRVHHRASVEPLSVRRRPARARRARRHRRALPVQVRQDGHDARTPSSATSTPASTSPSAPTPSRWTWSSELRWASILAKVTDANYQAGQPRDVFNAATLASCKFLRRDDLGRLAPGAKADILLIHARPPRRRRLRRSDQGAGGRRLRPRRGHGHRRRQGPGAGRPRRRAWTRTRCTRRPARPRTHYWSNVPTWRWDGAGVDRIVPPAFPMRSAAGS